MEARIKEFLALLIPFLGVHLGAATIILTRRRLSGSILARADPLLPWIRKPWPR
uniref:Uncharacterized protein n=1 Tax=Oryza rufipogon TaxID=4529 RepID=A0A0E0QX02_ORYRU